MFSISTKSGTCLSEGYIKPRLLYSLKRIIKHLSIFFLSCLVSIPKGKPFCLRVKLTQKHIYSSTTGFENIAQSILFTFLFYFFQGGGVKISIKSRSCFYQNILFSDRI